MREGWFVICPDSARNPIELSIPRLMWFEGGLVNLPGEDSRAGFKKRWLHADLSIWSSDWIHKSLEEEGKTKWYEWCSYTKILGSLCI